MKASHAIQFGPYIVALQHYIEFTCIEACIFIHIHVIIIQKLFIALLFFSPFGLSFQTSILFQN